MSGLGGILKSERPPKEQAAEALGLALAHLDELDARAQRYGGVTTHGFSKNARRRRNAVAKAQRRVNRTRR